MSRLLFLGEGPRDVGSDTSVGGDFEGDIPRLVRRIAESEGVAAGFGYDVASIILEPPDRPSLRPSRLGSPAKRLRDAALSALADDPSPLAIVAVLDVRHDRVDEAVEDARVIRKQAAARRPDVPVVIGLAVQEIEAWMLADEAARRAAFGVAGPLDGDPEAIADPKASWATRAGEADVPAGRELAVFQDQMRRAAWASLRPDVVATRCPRGFAPFLAAVRGAIVPLLRRR